MISDRLVWVRGGRNCQATSGEVVFCASRVYWPVAVLEGVVKSVAGFGLDHSLTGISIEGRQQLRRQILASEIGYEQKTVRS